MSDPEVCEMAWLLRDGEVLASVELGASRSSWARQVAAGRQVGALLVRPGKHAHSLGLRVPLDVAYLDADLTVLSLHRLAPHRLALPSRRAAAVLQAQAGAFDRWHLHEGDCLEIKD